MPGSTNDHLQLIPASVGRASRAWDDQHLDLEGVERQLTTTPYDGFSPPVAAGAAAFLVVWRVLAAALGAACEREADGLRESIREVVAADGDAAALLGGLLPYLREVR